MILSADTEEGLGGEPERLILAMQYGMHKERRFHSAVALNVGDVDTIVSDVEDMHLTEDERESSDLQYGPAESAAIERDYLLLKKVSDVRPLTRREARALDHLDDDYFVVQDAKGDPAERKD